MIIKIFWLQLQEGIFSCIPQRRKVCVQLFKALIDNLLLDMFGVLVIFYGFGLTILILSLVLGVILTIDNML